MLGRQCGTEVKITEPSATENSTSWACTYIPQDCKHHDNQEESEQASHSQYQDDGTKQQTSLLTWRLWGDGGRGGGEGCATC